MNTKHTDAKAPSKRLPGINLAKVDLEDFGDMVGQKLTKLTPRQVADRLRCELKDLVLLVRENKLLKPVRCRKGAPWFWYLNDMVCFEWMLLRGHFSRRRFTGKMTRHVKTIKLFPTEEIKPFTGIVPEYLREFVGDLYEAHVGPVVYFLYLEGTIQYVGVSIRSRKRLHTHRVGSTGTPRKEFDSVIMVLTPLQEIFERERVFIKLLNPPLNRAHCEREEM